jgi:hypothetical protein
MICKISLAAIVHKDGPGKGISFEIVTVKIQIIVASSDYGEIHVGIRDIDPPYDIRIFGS